MQMSDQREIQADPATVYAALLDPEVLKACVPGAQQVEGDPQQGYTATVVQKVGPVKATFRGRVSMADMVENESLTISGEGKGGAAGFARGGARVRLTPAADGGTILSYEVEARVGGKLAQLGSRIIDGFAKRMADQFFANLQKLLEAPADPGGGTGSQDVREGDETGAEGGATGEAGAAAARKRGWLGRLTGRGGAT